MRPFRRDDDLDLRSEDFAFSDICMCSLESCKSGCIRATDSRLQRDPGMVFSYQ